MNQTPIADKIDELVFPIDADENACKHIKQAMLVLAHYIKEEVTPEEKVFVEGKGFSGLTSIEIGENKCRSEVVDKFKELGI